MNKVSGNEITVVIVNPEAIPKAEERFTRIAYELYLESLTEVQEEIHMINKAE